MHEHSDHGHVTRETSHVGGGDPWYSAGAGMMLALVVALLAIALIVALVVVAASDDDGTGVPPNATAAASMSTSAQAVVKVAQKARLPQPSSCPIWTKPRRPSQRGPSALPNHRQIAKNS